MRRLQRLRKRPRWGNLRRLEPFSARFGYDRGQPIDRHYVDAFLAEHARDVTGRVLEVGERAYTARFGNAVTSSDVVDISPHNAAATITADLAAPGALPRQEFDCVLLVQTLQYVTDPGAALANSWESLRPGGVLFTAVPALTRHDLNSRMEDDRWRFTPAGLDTVLRSAAPGGDHLVRGYGNVLAAVAFLYGLAAEELRPRELDAVDESFPVVVVSRSLKARR